MRVCIPTEGDQGLQAKLAQHFGSAPFFTVIDLASGQISARANPACHSHPGACHHVSMLQGEKVEAVVSSGIGRNAFSALQQAGIQVLVPNGEVVTDVVAALQRGERTPMAFAGTCGGHGHGQGCGHGHEHGHEHGHGCGHGHQHRHRGASPEQTT